MIGRDCIFMFEGNFCIIIKFKNKEYYWKKIFGGVLNNFFGMRWFGLDKNEYVIYGMNWEWMIGSRELNGCICMYDRDI